MVLLIGAGPACAEHILPGALESQAQPHSTGKTMLIIEFGEKSPPGSKLGDAILQAKREFSPIESVMLPDERGLEKFLEARDDGSLGLIVLIRPQQKDALQKIAALYPDIYFTVIDIYDAAYGANVQNVQFREKEGVFLLGAIAAIRTDDRISVLALEDSERSKTMAETFDAGVRAIRPKANVSTQLNIRPTSTQRVRLSSTVSNAFQQGSSIIFSMDEDIIEQALRAARAERKMVIAGDTPPLGIDLSRLLTSLVKRYDLALLDVLRIYTHNQWHAGSIELGVAGGYVDYSLNADNVDVFPKEAIDRIEALKDHIGQGMYETTK